MTKRKNYLDIARTIAIMLVVLLHCKQRASIDIPYFSIAGMGVPIFLLISGGLMIPKAEALDILSFYKKYAKRIFQFIILIPICGVITTTTAWYMTNIDLTLPQIHSIGSAIHSIQHVHSSIYNAFIKALTTENGIFPKIFTIADSHIWYLYLIIGLYLLTPFIAKITKRATTIELIIFLALIIASNIGTSFLSRILIYFRAEYLSYYIIGYLLIARNIPNQKHISFKIIIIIGLIFLLFDIKIQFLNIYSHFVSILIILFLREYGNYFHHKFFESLSKYSFGIYLWHPFILWIISVNFSLIKLANQSYIGFIVFFITSFLLSWLLSFLLSKMRLTSWLAK